VAERKAAAVEGQTGQEGQAKENDQPAPAQKRVRRQQERRRAENGNSKSQEEGHPEEQSTRRKSSVLDAAAPEEVQQSNRHTSSSSLGEHDNGTHASGEESEEEWDSKGYSSWESSFSSSSPPRSPSPGAMAIAKALALGQPLPQSTTIASKNPCFAWERAIAPVSSHLQGPQSAIFNPVAMPAGPMASTQETELFLAAGGVDGEAALRLRALPPHLQRVVIERGPVTGTRNPSSVVISRIREVEMGRLTPSPGQSGLASFAPQYQPLSVPNPEIEKFITTHSIDPQASSMLRKLSPEQQRVALKMPIKDARNKSAFVMTQLSMTRGLMALSEQSRLFMQPTGMPGSQIV